MPFGPYRNHEHCVRVVSHRKNPPKDPDAYCAFIKGKVEGEDPEYLELIAGVQKTGEERAKTHFKISDEEWNKLSPEEKKKYIEKLPPRGQQLQELFIQKYHQHLIDNPLEGIPDTEVMGLMNKDDAKRILDAPGDLKEWADAQLIDDHRWVHLWERTLKKGHNLFLNKNELRKLHDYIVQEMKKRGMDSGKDHKSPIELTVLEMSSPAQTTINNREAILLDPEFISIVGSAVLKQDPADIDIMLKCPHNEKYKQILLETLPTKYRDKLDFVWETTGPNGPYIPAYALYAVPVEKTELKEPKFDISPLSPILPATPTKLLEDPRNLIEDSYYVEPYDGIRTMIHRREGVLVAFDKDLEEVDLPPIIAEELLGISDPSTFILDGFLGRENGEPVFHMIDLTWWRESQHVKQDAETRKYFLNKMPELDHVKRSKCKYFPNRKEAIEFLNGEKGPYLLIPGMTPYPNDGKAQWLLYDHKEAYKFAESSDAQIKELVDAGKWESLSADERFNLMTKRKTVEPLYPYAQMKTTKKGYSQKEVFGLKSVGELAKDLFKVPSKQAVEVKIDGFRTQIHKEGNEVKIFTESGYEITHTLPGIVKGIKKLPGESFVLDAEATPYDEDFTNLGRAGAAPAFAKGAKGPVDDKRWALHVFDMLYIDGEQIHSLPYTERRQRLRGIELPIREYPKKDSDFAVQLWENGIKWATSAEQMIKNAEEVAKVPGSEGAMFKESDSKYRLNGNTPLWSKMKSSFEIDALVVGVRKEGNTYTYLGAVGPVDLPKDATAETIPVDIKNYGAYVKHKGSVYTILGKTFNTSIVAEIGDIIRVSMKNIGQIEENLYHWFHPQVLEKREDKTTPDPLETAKEIHETGQQQQKVKAVSWDVVNGEIKVEGGVRSEAYLVSARLSEESPLACCYAPWVAIPDVESMDFIYLQNNEEVWDKLTELGVERLVASGTERELYEQAMKHGVYYQITHFPTIRDFAVGDVTIYAESPENSAEVYPEELKQFYDSIRPMQHECMKLSCGGIVPLYKLKLQQNLYQTYPEEAKEWKYVIQFHVRGLSVHADFRCQVSKSQLIGWTWDLGKSLIKPMLRRTPESLRAEAGIKAEDLELPIKELSAKLRSTPEGRRLQKALSKKVETLKGAVVKTMLKELWKEEAEPILGDANKKILTQIKHPMSVAWLDYEDEIPAGAVGATSELGGRMYIMDEGRCQYGAQKSYYHEYWLDGKIIKNRRMLVRKIAARESWGTRESFAWLTFFSKPEETPYAISSRAVSQNWMPPPKTSALPEDVRGQIPANRQYWNAKNGKEIRDQLVKDIKSKDITLKLAAGMKFTVKRVWHKGPEVRRGLPVTRYWLLFYSGNKIHGAWDFGRDNNPLDDGGIIVRRRDPKGLDELLKQTGELPAKHPASQTKSINNFFDTSDSGSAQMLKDSDNQMMIRFNGGKLKGDFVFIKESGEMWTFGPASISEEKKAMLLQAASCTTQCSTTGVLHLAASDMEFEQIGDLLFLRGPAIKPGEVLPMDGRPSYFTKEGIKRFWPSMYRQPIVVLHGDLKGDVIGFVSKNWYDEETGWGWIEGIVWHPQGIKLIMEKKLPAFSIEVIPESVWDAEHKHEHIIGGTCVGLAVVPKGACVTCTPTEATMGTITVEKGKVFKYGMTAEEYIAHEYWALGKSTQEISEVLGKPRSTVESWMNQAKIPRRSLTEARHLRQYKEELERNFGGRAFITNIGKGALLLTIGEEHLLINAPEGIAAMLGIKKLKPKCVLIADNAKGVNELGALAPPVLATEKTWNYLRSINPDFEYKGKRMVAPVDKIIKIGRYMVKPSEVEGSTIYKIDAAGSVILHASTVPTKLSDELLNQVDIFIGDSTSLKEDVDGHVSMISQILQAKDAEILKIFFTEAEEFTDELQDLAPNAAILEAGAEVQLSPGNPGAHFSLEEAERITTGESKIIVRAKPYQEYAKQAIYLLGGDKILGLYVEGYPEGPIPVEKAKEMEHGLSEKEWNTRFSDAKEVWIYEPRMLKTFEQARGFRVPEMIIGPYINHVKAQEVE